MLDATVQVRRYHEMGLLLQAPLGRLFHYLFGDSSLVDRVEGADWTLPACDEKVPLGRLPEHQAVALLFDLLIHLRLLRLRVKKSNTLLNKI